MLRQKLKTLASLDLVKKARVVCYYCITLSYLPVRIFQYAKYDLIGYVIVLKNLVRVERDLLNQFMRHS